MPTPLTYKGNLDFQNQQLKTLVPQADGTNAIQSNLTAGSVELSVSIAFPETINTTTTGILSTSIAYPVPVTFAANAGIDSSSIAFPVTTLTHGVTPVASATGGYGYKNLPAGQATTTVKVGAGTLHTITLNSAAAATNVTTIFDSLTNSGSIIGIPAVVTATVPTTLIYDLAFNTGLTIETKTANGGDMTINYK